MDAVTKQDMPNGHLDGKIVTSVRLRVWWLRVVRGYHLDVKRREPRQSLIGQMYYKNHWVLTKPEKK